MSRRVKYEVGNRTAKTAIDDPYRLPHFVLRTSYFALRDRPAFTLLEMLVALAMMTVLAASLYASLYVGFRARQRADAALEPVRTLGLTMDLLQRDIASILPPTGVLAGPMLGENGMTGAFSSDTDSLTFHSASGEGAAQTCDIRKIELAVTGPADDAKQCVLVRRVTSNLLAPEAPQPTEEVLCRAVRTFNLRYFDGTEWLDSWDSTQQDNSLPVALEVTISVDLPDSTPENPRTYEQVRVFALPCYQMPEELQGAVQVVRPTSR